jgi:hypothetical protein
MQHYVVNAHTGSVIQVLRPNRESGAGWQDANPHAEDLDTKRFADPFAHDIREIPNSRCPNRAAYPNGQAALIDTGAGNRLCEPGRESRPNLLKHQRSLRGAVFEYS